MKLQITAIFDSTTTKSNGQQVMRMKFPYTEIANYSKLLLVLGKPLKSVIVTEEGEKIKLGNIMLDKITIDKDGEAKATILGILNEMDIQMIPNIIEKVVYFKIKTDEGEE